MVANPSCGNPARLLAILMVSPSGGAQRMAQRKSVILALVLTLFLGPFGMLYSTIPGAIVMLVLYLALGIPTLGWAIVGLHPIAIIWGVWAAHRANQ
jgi:hypothetical protein